MSLCRLDLRLSIIAEIQDRLDQGVSVPQINSDFKETVVTPVTLLINPSEGLIDEYWKSNQDVDTSIKEGIEGSVASPATVNKIKEVALKMGVSFKKLSDYAKETGLDITGVNGLADTVKGIIALAEGKENVSITEEFVHIATAILEQTNPELITAIISKIGNYQIYKDTFEKYKDNPKYQVNGKPNIRKIKKEAADKLISELIVNEGQNIEDFPELEDPTIADVISNWWNTILDYFRKLYRKSNIDIFEETKSSILYGNIGTVANLSGGDVFFQLDEPNQVVDNIYNKYIEEDEKIIITPKTNDKKRHYDYDGQEVSQSVTEYVKAGEQPFERTDEEKIDDNYKKDWGTAGHDYIQDFILGSLIDKLGYKRLTPDKVNIPSTLAPEVRNIIEQYAHSLINSYPEGTRFLVERKVVNKKVKGMRASRIDFIAIEPITKKDGTKDARVDILDWKFTSVDKNKADDIPWFKVKPWKAQMGEYAQMAYNYGVTSGQLRKTRMVPFIANYVREVPGNKKSPLIMNAVQVGKLDSSTETNIFLLPVALDTESTGNREIDTLLTQLRNEYNRMYIVLVDPEDKFNKNEQLKQFSRSIRQLHMKLDFSPLIDVGNTFLLNAAESFKTFENVNYDNMNQEQIEILLGTLQEFKNSANAFTTLDSVYISMYPNKSQINQESKELLKSLEHISGMAKRMLEKIAELEKEFVSSLFIKEGFATEDTVDSVMAPDVELERLSRNFLEGSSLSSTTIQLATKLIKRSKSVVAQDVADLTSQYGDVLSELIKDAEAIGKSPFDMIGRVTENDLQLIEKLDEKFRKQVWESRQNGKLQFLKDNMNVESYMESANKLIEKQIKNSELTQYSTDPEENENIKAYRKTKIRDSLDITRPTFNGFMDYDFGRLFNETVKEEDNYSKDFLEMAKTPSALKMWKFFQAINNVAKDAGYIKKSLSFFPLMEATVINKIAQSKNGLGEVKEFFDDLYTVDVDESLQYSRNDKTTGQVKREVPKLFTRSNKTVARLSKDLTKIGPFWIKAVLDYRATKNLEHTLNVIDSFEKTRGVVEIDPVNKGVILEGGKPKINYDKTTNRNALRAIVDDHTYGIKEDESSLGNIALNGVTDKLTDDLETKEKRKASTRKVIKNSASYMQALALGWRATVAIPNYMGNNMQAYINGAGVYYPGEFQKNNWKITTGVGLTNEDKALLNLTVPLQEDIAKEMQRKLAKEQGIFKTIGTWTFQDVMMVMSSWPDRQLEYANAMSFNKNAMIVNGKIVSILQYIAAQDRAVKYNMTESERKALEKTYDARVAELKETSSLYKVAEFGEKGKVILPGVSKEELADYRVRIQDHMRNINGKMSEDDKSAASRDTILNSFMMFRKWIPKQIGVRTLGLRKNATSGNWEYGRTRAFIKVWSHLGTRNIMKMRDIMTGSDVGLRIMDEMLIAKKQEYFRKTGKELEITKEEFYDMMRKELSNQMKELGLLLSIMGLAISAAILGPDDDDDQLTKNRYKYFLKIINKTRDEISFYYNPLSFEQVTNGSLLPQLGLLTKALKLINAVGVEGYAWASDDEELMDKNHTIKYLLDPIVGLSQIERDIIPLLYPELAKDLGVTVTSQARQGR